MILKIAKLGLKYEEFDLKYEEFDLTNVDIDLKNVELNLKNVELNLKNVELDLKNVELNLKNVELIMAQDVSVLTLYFQVGSGLWMRIINIIYFKLNLCLLSDHNSETLGSSASKHININIVFVR